jgi:ATP-dependent Clp protease adaptor protein ClpS
MRLGPQQTDLFLPVPGLRHWQNFHDAPRLQSAGAVPVDVARDLPCRAGIVWPFRRVAGSSYPVIIPVFPRRIRGLKQFSVKGGIKPPRMARQPSQPPDTRDGDGSNTAVLTRTRTRTRKPNLYRVLLLNDDYTPMEFVVHILERFFNKSVDEATLIMLHVHQNGVGECGVFTYEVAETKVTMVMDFARKHQHPLQCVMEKK